MRFVCRAVLGLNSFETAQVFAAEADPAQALRRAGFMFDLRSGGAARAARDGGECALARAFQAARGGVGAAHRAAVRAGHVAPRPGLARGAAAGAERDGAGRVFAAVDAARIPAGARAGRLTLAGERATRPADRGRKVTGLTRRAGAARSGAGGGWVRGRAAAGEGGPEDQRERDQERVVSCHAS